MGNNKKYICITDHQQTDFQVGEVATIDEWKEKADDWCNNDNAEPINWNNVDNVIDFISEIWQLEIVEFDENNLEHIELLEDK